MPPKATTTGAGTSGKKGANVALTKPIPSELIAPFAPNNNTAVLLGLPDGSGLPFVVNPAGAHASSTSITSTAAGGATVSSSSPSGNVPSSLSSATTASGSSSSAAGNLTGATLVPPTPAVAPTSTMFDFAANSANFHKNNPNSPDGLVNFTLVSLKDAIAEHLKSLTAAQRELAISEFYKVAISLSFAHLPSASNALSSSLISSVIGGGADLSAGLLGAASDTVASLPLTLSSAATAASGPRGGGSRLLLYEIAKAVGMSEGDSYTLSRNALMSLCNDSPSSQPPQQAASQIGLIPPYSATAQQPATGAQHIHPLFNKMTHLTFNALAKPVRALVEFHNKQLVHRQAFLHLQKSRVKANCIRVRLGRDDEGEGDSHNTRDKKNGKGGAQIDIDTDKSYYSPSSTPSPSGPALLSSATQLVLTGSLAAPLVAHINQQELREKARQQTQTVAIALRTGGGGGEEAGPKSPLSLPSSSAPPTFIPPCILPMNQTRSLVAVNAAKGEVSLTVPVLPAIDGDLVVHRDIRSKDSLQGSLNDSAAAVARARINNQKAANLLLSSALYSESSVDDLAEAITSQLVDALFYSPHAPHLLQPPHSLTAKSPLQPKVSERDLSSNGSGGLAFSMLASALPCLGHTNNESALLSTATGLAVAAASLPSQVVHYSGAATGSTATQSQPQQTVSGTSGSGILAPFPPSVPPVSMSGANATLAAMCLHGCAAMPQQLVQNATVASTSLVSPTTTTGGVSGGNIAAVGEASSFSYSSPFSSSASSIPHLLSAVLPSSTLYISALGIPAQISHSSNASSLLPISQLQQGMGGGGGGGASLPPSMAVPPPPPGLGVVADAFGKLASVQSLCSSAHIAQGLQHHGYSLALAEQLRHVITSGGRTNFFGGGYGEQASQISATSSSTCTHGGVKGLATALQNTNNTEINLNEINSAASSAPAVRLLANDHSRRYTLMICRGSLLAPSSSSPYTSHHAAGGGGASSPFSPSRGAATASPSFNRGAAASPTSQLMNQRSQTNLSIKSTSTAGVGNGGGNFGEGSKRPLGRQQHKREQIYCIGLLEGEEQIIGIDLKRNDPFATAEMKSAAAADLEAKPRLLQSLISKTNPYRLVLGGVAPSKALQRHKELVAAAAAHSISSYSSPPSSVTVALSNSSTAGGRRKGGAAMGESFINGDSEEDEDMAIEDEDKDRKEDGYERSKTNNLPSSSMRHSPIAGGGRGQIRRSPSRARSPRGARSISASPSALSQKQGAASQYPHNNNNNNTNTGKVGPSVAKNSITDTAVSYDDDDAFPAESDVESEVTFLSIAVGSSHCLICVLDKTNNQTYVYGRGSTVAGALGPQRPIETNGPAAAAASSVKTTASLSEGGGSRGAGSSYYPVAANATTPTKTSKTLFKGLKGLPDGEKEQEDEHEQQDKHNRALPSPQQQQSHLLSSTAVTKDRTKLFFRLGQEVAAARALEMQQHHQQQQEQEETASLLLGDLSSLTGGNGTNNNKTHTQNADEACWRSESVTFAPIGCLCEKGIRSVYAGGDFTLAASSEGLYGVGTLHNISLTCGSPALLLPLRAEDVIVDVCIGSERAYVLLEGNRLFCLDGNISSNKFEEVTETVLGPMLRYERTTYEKALCAYQQIAAAAAATTTTATSASLDTDNDGFGDNLEKAPTAESMLERLRRRTRPQRTAVSGGGRRRHHGADRGSNRRTDYAGLNDDYGERSDYDDEEDEGTEEDDDDENDNNEYQERREYYYHDYDEASALELSVRAPTAAGRAADGKNPTTQEGTSSIYDDVAEFSNFISTDADLPLYANMSVIGSDVDPRDPYGAFTFTSSCGNLPHSPRDQSTSLSIVPDPLIGTPLRFGLGIGGSRARIIENTENEMFNKKMAIARSQAEEKSKLESHRRSPAGKASHRGTATQNASPLTPTTSPTPTPAPIPVSSKQPQRAAAANHGSNTTADKSSKKGGGTNNNNNNAATAKGPGASAKNINVSPSSSATPPSGGGGGTTTTRRVSDSAASVTNDEKRRSASRDASAANATTGNTTKSKKTKGPHSGSEADSLPRIWLKQSQNSNSKTLTPTHAYLSLANSSSSALGKVYGLGTAARAGGPSSPAESASPPPPPPPPPTPIVLTSLKGGRDHWVVQDKHTSRLYGWGNNNFGQLGNEKEICGRLQWVCGGGEKDQQRRSLHSATPSCVADRGGEMRSSSSPSHQSRADKDSLATTGTGYRHYAVPLAVDVMKAVGDIHRYLASTTLAGLGSVAKIAEPLLLLTSSSSTAEGNAQLPNSSSSSSNSAAAIATTTQQYPWSAFSSANASLASVLSLAGVSALSPHFPHAGLVKASTAASSIPSLLGDRHNTPQSCRGSQDKKNNSKNDSDKYNTGGSRRTAPIPPSSTVQQSDVFDPFYRTLRYFVRELYETAPILLAANSSLSAALTGSSAGGGSSLPLATAAAVKKNLSTGGAMTAPSRGGSANNSTNSSNKNNAMIGSGGGAVSLSHASTAAERERQRVLATLQGMSSAEVALFIADQPDAKGIFITPPPYAALLGATLASAGGGAASKGTAIISSPRGVSSSNTAQFSVPSLVETSSPLALSPMEAIDLPSGVMISSYVCLGWCTIVEISALVRDVSHVLIEGYRRKVTAELEARDTRAEAKIRQTIGNTNQGRILSVATAAAASTLPSLVAGSTQSSAGPNNANKSSSVSYSSTPDGDGALTLGELNTRIGKIMGTAASAASQAQTGGGGGGSIKPTVAAVASPASGGPSYLKKPAVTKVEVVAPEVVPLEAVPPILRRVSIILILGSTSAPLQ